MLCELGLIGKVTHKARAEHWAHRGMRPRENHLSACWFWHPPIIHSLPTSQKTFQSLYNSHWKEPVLLSKASYSVVINNSKINHLDHWSSSIFNQNTDPKLSAIRIILWEREKGMRSSRTQLLKLLIVNPHGAPQLIMEPWTKTRQVLNVRFPKVNSK